MAFKDVSNKVNFVKLEHEILHFWQETDAFNELRRLRAESEAEYGIYSFHPWSHNRQQPHGRTPCLGTYLQRPLPALSGDARQKSTLAKWLRLPGFVG